MIGYMGITPKNFENLKNHTGKQYENWTCSSYDDLVYFYTPIKYCEEDTDILSDIIWNGIVQATNTKETSILLVKMEIEDKIVEDDISEDYTNTAYQKCFDSKHFNEKMILSTIELKFDMCILYSMINSLLQNKVYIFNSEIYSDNEMLFINHINFDFLYELLENLRKNIDFNNFSCYN